MRRLLGLVLLRCTEAALPTYIDEKLYGDECWPKKAQNKKEKEQCYKAAQAEIRDCETCNEAKDGRCTRFAEVTPATTTFTPRHGHASAVFPYRADADSPAELAIYVVGGRTDQYEKWNFQRTSRLADVWIYTIEKNDWQQLRQLRGDFVRRTSSAFLMEDVQQPGDIAPFWERFGHSLDVVVATVRLDRDQYKTRKDNVTVVMADEVRGADAVDEGKDCRQDGGDQCCICRLDLLKCAQDPATTNVACKAAQAQGLGWQAVRDNYLDYQLDEQMGCFEVYPSWTGNEPRKESVDWAYIKEGSTDSEARPCAYKDEARGGSDRDCAGEPRGTEKNTQNLDVNGEFLSGPYRGQLYDDVLAVAVDSNGDPVVDYLDSNGNPVGGNLKWTPQRTHVPCIVAEDRAEVDAMILLGGFTPKPDRDVWASRDGVSWWFVGEAPWPARGYHSSAMFRGRLFIMGGSPLTNDVWAGTFEWRGYEKLDDRRDVFWLGELDEYVVREKWEMSWELVAPATGLFDYPESWNPVSDARRWMPRAGAGVTVQFSRKNGWGYTFQTQRVPEVHCKKVRNEQTDTLEIPETCKISQLMREPTSVIDIHPETGPRKVLNGPNQSQEALFLTGGLAGWPERHPLFDGQKARNDVWYTRDGANWTLRAEFAPWPARAWHSLVAWSEPSDVYSDIAFNARMHDATPHAEEFGNARYRHDGRLAPRMWLTGGGYVGKQGIAVTKMVDAYADLWWSRDGITWAQVGMAEGSERYICSTLEIFKIQEANEDFFLGKYSHTMVPFFYRHDVPVCGRPEKDATTGLLSPVDCAAPLNGDPLIRRPDGDKKEVVRVPTLYFIGGDPGYLEGEDLGPQLTMFRSEANILCELDGIMCPTRTGSVAAYSTLEDGPSGWPEKDRAGSRFGVPWRRPTCAAEMLRSKEMKDDGSAANPYECNPDSGVGDALGGFCPSPLFGRGDRGDSFFEAENGTAFLEDPVALGHSVDDSFAHPLSKRALFEKTGRKYFHMTVYNATNVSATADPRSLVGRFRATRAAAVTFKEEPLVRDFIVRLTGCWCHSYYHRGEYCEYNNEPDGAGLLRPSLALILTCVTLGLT